MTINKKTVLGTAEPTNFVFQPVAAESAAETDVPLVEQVNRVHAIDLLNETSSEFSSFAQTFCPPQRCPRKDCLKMRNVLGQTPGC